MLSTGGLGFEGSVWSIFLIDQRSRHTRRAYRRALGLHPGEEASLSELDGALRAVRSESSRHAMACCWRSAALWSVRMGLEGLGSGMGLRSAQPGRKVVRAMATEEVHRLYAAATSPRDRAILDCLFGLGMRAGELAGARLAGDVLTWLAKGRKRRSEVVPAGLSVSPALGLSYRQVYRAVRRLSRSAGLGVSPHWLRHAHATEAYRGGADIWEISESLGHASIATTRLYLHGRRSPASIAAGLVAGSGDPAK